MITITIYGLDQFIVGDLSKDMTQPLADLYECHPDDINFVACQNMVFHNGVDQTSWNTIVKVNAPMKVRVLQNDVANLIINMVLGPTINVSVEFYYYSEDDRYESINQDYPRFITESNAVHTDECEDDDCDCGCDHDHDDGPEVFTGDIFKDFNK